jgi:Tfp pilus assembly protein PilF
MSLRDYKAAVESLTQALRFQPDDAEALVNLGYAYAGQKHYSKAFVFVRKAVSLEPNLVEAEALLGFLYLVTNDRSSAIQQYQVLKNLDVGAAQELYAQIYRGRIVDAAPLVTH